MYSPQDLARQYQQQQILNASPAQQVVMMYDGAIKFTVRARECIEKKDIQGRHNNNRRAMEIINYLMEILDEAKGGQVATRLKRIYAFLIRRYMQVDFQNKVEICDEILGHLRTLRGSWEAIAKNEKKPQSEPGVRPTSAVA